jgi:hypothetical protein
MEILTQHIGTLLGRLFLITNKKAIKEWGGVDGEEGQSDYDSIIDNVNAEEAGLASFSKASGLEYLTFICMSSKIEIFKSTQGIVICEGLFFNESWDYTKPITIEDIEETSNRITIDEELMVIIDAAVNGGDLSLASDENTNEYCAIQLENGDYEVSKILLKIEIDNSFMDRMGIKLTKI